MAFAKAISKLECFIQVRLFEELLTSSKYFNLNSITKAISNAPYPYFLGVFHRIVILLRITGHSYFNHRHFPFALTFNSCWDSYITDLSTAAIAIE